MFQRHHGHTREIRDANTNFGRHFAGPCEDYTLTLLDRQEEEDNEELLKMEGDYLKIFPEARYENGGGNEREEGQFIRDSYIIQN